MKRICKYLNTRCKEFVVTRRFFIRSNARDQFNNNKFNNSKVGQITVQIKTLEIFSLIHNIARVIVT